MKHKLLLRKLSISASKMTVRRELPLPFKIVFWMVPLALCSTLTFGAYETGRRIASADHDAPSQTAKPDDTTESRMNIERAAQNHLTEQIKSLETENARLKEELAFFNSLMPAGANAASGITIPGLALESISSNQFRFRALVMKGSNDKQRFAGNLQLVVTAQKGNETINLVFPKDKSQDAEKFKIGFRHYQRLEGNLSLPDGAQLKHVQARVMENGHVRAQRVAEASL
jgi:hypothetical protein